MPLPLAWNHRHARFGILHPRAAWLADECNDVMNQSRIARARFGQLDVLVFGEAGWDHDVLIVDGARRWDIEGNRHGEHHVRLADAPAFYPLRRLRTLFRIARLRASVRPSCERVDFGLRQ